MVKYKFWGKRGQRLSSRGFRVMVDPGHGIYWNGKRWIYQRPCCRIEGGRVICKGADIYTPGYIEDEGVMFVAYRLIKRLIREGVVVYTTRAIDLKTGELDRRKSDFIPGKERWQEGALLYLYKTMGWSPKGGYRRDLRIRWRYENEVSSHLPIDSCQLIYVSIHTNAGGGYGTETYTSGSSKSRRLATLIHKNLLESIRTKFPEWREHGKNPRKGNFAVLKYTLSPAVLIELGFHDSTDLRYLIDDEWRELAAQGIFEGIMRYF